MTIRIRRPFSDQAIAHGRREFLTRWAHGLGGLAMGTMLPSSALSQPSHPARAKSVIYLYMDGGPSQMDTFDPKPRLNRDHGRRVPFPINSRFASHTLMGSSFQFKKWGESGIDVSDLFPSVAQHVDHMTVIRSMVSEHLEHGMANLFMQTGSSLPGRPSLGSWFLYGLGLESQDLPNYITLYSNGQPQGGLNAFRNGFLPGKHRPTTINQLESPMTPNIAPSETVAGDQWAKIELRRRLVEANPAPYEGWSEFESAVAHHELAFRMQTSLPEALDVGRESKATQRLYGVDAPATEVYGKTCLMARRLVERGVRFVIALPPTDPRAARWDQHDSLEKMHRSNAALVDRPIAGLLADLDARGLLDQTLVIWGGEFGRTPMAEIIANQDPGREHNPYGFSMWLAGGGVKKGYIHGATDEFGYQAVENPVTVHDLHATILHLLGFDHTRLTFRHAGRDYRLTDVHGQVVDQLLA